MCYIEQLPQKERDVFCINKIHHGKLPKFYHILLQDYNFFVNHSYPEELPNVITVHNKPSVFDFLQQSIPQEL